jgi:hypothetical protein
MPQTTFNPDLKYAQERRRWHHIDADGVVLGRLATKAATLLRGKHKRFFTPAVDCGDFVVVTNAAKIKLTGNKLEQKGYFSHSSFAGGAKVGLKLATFVMLIFGSMLFAGEFDRGTIKILLTRPITRTDLFVAKSAVAVFLALFLVGAVLYVSLAVGCLVGELGPVWDDQSYNSNTSYERLLEHARKAVVLSVPAIVAAGFFGVLISAMSESSGFAVAVTLTLFLLVDEVVLRAVRDDRILRFFFNHYPPYAFDVLRDFARGSSTHWKGIFEAKGSFLTVPLGSMAAFLGASYAFFRSRNIMA